MPAYDRAHREQVELERGDDTEPAAAAAGRPQQVAVGLVGRADERAVGQHQLDSGDRAALQPVLAGVPAQAAAERRPDDADAGARRVQRREADAAGSLHHVTPEHPGADPRGASRGVDAQLGHGRGPQQDGVTRGGPRAEARHGRCPEARP